MSADALWRFPQSHWKTVNRETVEDWRRTTGFAIVVPPRGHLQGVWETGTIYFNDETVKSLFVMAFGL